MRILLVEDEDAIAEPLVQGLRREGYDVTRAATGEAALEAPPEVAGELQRSAELPRARELIGALADPAACSSRRASHAAPRIRPTPNIADSRYPKAALLTKRGA